VTVRVVTLLLRQPAETLELRLRSAINGNQFHRAPEVVRALRQLYVTCTRAHGRQRRVVTAGDAVNCIDASGSCDAVSLYCAARP
jgi:hypothetical protein